MYKDVWPYWLTRWILALLFLFLFFCYKPIVLPEIKYVNRIKLNTIDNHLEQSLWVSICVLKTQVNKFSCTQEEAELYWCEDNPICETCEWRICGILDTIISSWAILPSSWTDTIMTADSWQTEMMFEVYQWDDIVAQKNKILQTWIVITWLPSKNALEAWVTINFNVDKNWYLSFKIIDKDDKFNSTGWSILIPNNWYEIVPEWNISMFELIKRELWRIFR